MISGSDIASLQISHWQALNILSTRLFVESNLLGSMHVPRMAKHNVNAWLINTGWTGGAFGTGHRMSLKDLQHTTQCKQNAAEKTS